MECSDTVEVFHIQNIYYTDFWEETLVFCNYMNCFTLVTFKDT